MRLICGFLNLDDQPADASTLETMLQAMIEPGLTPHVARVVAGPMAMGVLDFRDPLGALPQSVDGLVMAADARIHEPRSTDHAALLAALGQQDIAPLGKLIGEFAVAAWDPSTTTLTCARDGMGVRPLFFSHQAGRIFAFASLPRSLHASGVVEWRVDSDFLMSELLGAMPGPQRSLFQGIERVAAGERLRVSSRGVERERHWQLERSAGGRYQGSPEQAVEQMTLLLSEAVHCRLPAQGPVAAHLSGGLDSSSIAILAARYLRQTGQPLLSYSFMPGRIEGLDLHGEADYVHAVVQQEPDIDSRSIRIDDPVGFLFPRMDCDLPHPDDGTHPEIQVCIDAAAAGTDTVLSGWGGDEGTTFNGRGVLAQALFEGRWGYVAEEIRALARTRRLPVSRLIRGELLPYLLPGAVVKEIRRRRGSSQIRGMHTLLADRTVELGKPIRMGRNADENRWQLLAEQTHLMRRMEQWALIGARHGIAFTFPMLDRRVLELAWSLPGRHFIRGGWKRRVIRDAMAEVLPAKIRWRHDKLSPFPEVLVLQSLHRDALLAWIDELRGHALICELFDLSAIRQRIERLPSPSMARQMAKAEDHTRMATAGKVIPMSLIHALAYLQQYH